MESVNLKVFFYLMTGVPLMVQKLESDEVLVIPDRVMQFLHEVRERLDCFRRQQRCDA